jgi:hypothetical protein
MTTVRAHLTPHADIVAGILCPDHQTRAEHLFFCNDGSRSIGDWMLEMLHHDDAIHGAAFAAGRTLTDLEWFTALDAEYRERQKRAHRDLGGAFGICSDTVDCYMGFLVPDVRLIVATLGVVG